MPPRHDFNIVGKFFDEYRYIERHSYVVFTQFKGVHGYATSGRTFLGILGNTNITVLYFNTSGKINFYTYEQTPVSVHFAVYNMSNTVCTNFITASGNTNFSVQTAYGEKNCLFSAFRTAEKGIANSSAKTERFSYGMTGKYVASGRFGSSFYSVHTNPYNSTDNWVHHVVDVRETDSETYLINSNYSPYQAYYISDSAPAGRLTFTSGFNNTGTNSNCSRYNNCTNYNCSKYNNCTNYNCSKYNNCTNNNCSKYNNCTNYNCSKYHNCTNNNGSRYDNCTKYHNCTSGNGTRHHNCTDYNNSNCTDPFAWAEDFAGVRIPIWIYGFASIFSVTIIGGAIVLVICLCRKKRNNHENETNLQDLNERMLSNVQQPIAMMPPQPVAYVVAYPQPVVGHVEPFKDPYAAPK
ncbi:hypothetical protein TVAG_358970 [Trichomonas vaginalis G3]|uniref:Uncharacterized protein n=1 Tax=Trichomonas vaginalis (strain ATCC PRA-98 / G3) TaxID=412133 RepID=A2E8A0_TRIV3|nr:hypothetical protein TVAGG3_1027080 [Trichomonas vaginalis G3]EAY11118.1 hypothetical protein TVAG_358970 [Trichomonas vaginalis G3]KAI5492580.1 hypothetical protein TVAGG3_1027080 [Trichomonas vaginalis G3]|eukprot:XP_001323341.1 hypothetical protein [Trichomonas vaginalis G3]